MLPVAAGTLSSSAEAYKSLGEVYRLVSAVSFKGAAGGPAGTINDSFILPQGIPRRKLQQLVARLNCEAGILPEESVK